MPYVSLMPESQSSDTAPNGKRGRIEVRGGEPLTFVEDPVTGNLPAIDGRSLDRLRHHSMNRPAPFTRRTGKRRPRQESNLRHTVLGNRHHRSSAWLPFSHPFPFLARE